MCGVEACEGYLVYNECLFVGKGVNDFVVWCDIEVLEEIGLCIVLVQFGYCGIIGLLGGLSKINCEINWVCCVCWCEIICNWDSVY